MLIKYILYYHSVINVNYIQELSLSGSVVLMSDSAGSCQAGQPSNVKQADGSGTLTMTSYGMKSTNLSPDN